MPFQLLIKILFTFFEEYPISCVRTFFFESKQEKNMILKNEHLLYKLGLNPRFLHSETPNSGNSVA